MPRVLFVHHRPQASGAIRSLALLIAALDERWEAHVLVPAGAAAAVLAEAGATVHTGPVPAFTHTWDVQYRGLRWLVLLREALSFPGHARRLRRLLRELEPGGRAPERLGDARERVPRAPPRLRGWSGICARRSRVAAATGAAASSSARSTPGATPRSRSTRTSPGRFHCGCRSKSSRTPSSPRPGEPATLPVPEGRVTVGYFGYLRRQKGWPQLVEAMRILVDAGAPVHAVVVGGGVRPPEAFRGVRGRLLRRLGIPDEERDLRARVEELGLTDRFSFLPFTTDPGPIYRALDIVVFPNQGAGLGRPVLEAAAYGKPVVASGSPDGAGQIVDGRTGFLLHEARPTRSPRRSASLCAIPSSVESWENAARSSQPGSGRARPPDLWRQSTRRWSRGPTARSGRRAERSRGRSPPSARSSSRSSAGAPARARSRP